MGEPNYDYFSLEEQDRLEEEERIRQAINVEEMNRLAPLLEQPGLNQDTARLQMYTGFVTMAPPDSVPVDDPERKWVDDNPLLGTVYYQRCSEAILDRWEQLMQASYQSAEEFVKASAQGPFESIKQWQKTVEQDVAKNVSAPGVETILGTLEQGVPQTSDTVLRKSQEIQDVHGEYQRQKEAEAEAQPTGLPTAPTGTLVGLPPAVAEALREEEFEVGAPAEPSPMAIEEIPPLESFVPLAPPLEGTPVSPAEVQELLPLTPEEQRALTPQEKERLITFLAAAAEDVLAMPEKKITQAIENRERFLDTVDEAQAKITNAFEQKYGLREQWTPTEVATVRQILKDAGYAKRYIDFFLDPSVSSEDLYRGILAEKLEKAEKRKQAKQKECKNLVVDTLINTFGAKENIKDVLALAINDLVALLIGSYSSGQKWNTTVAKIFGPPRDNQNRTLVEQYEEGVDTVYSNLVHKIAEDNAGVLLARLLQEFGVTVEDYQQELDVVKEDDEWVSTTGAYDLLNVPLSTVV